MEDKVSPRGCTVAVGVGVFVSCSANDFVGL